MPLLKIVIHRVDETRPRLQGARLTSYELMEAGVPMHLIPDNAAGLLMLQGKVDIVLYGADRVAANGDVVNKIGTYKISVLAKENGVPVYAVVPTSTIDLTVACGKDIVIEERSEDEVTVIDGVRIAPAGVKVFNPAFDYTPFRYITGIITEEGICYPPFSMSLADAKRKAEAKRAPKFQQSKSEASTSESAPAPSAVSQTSASTPTLSASLVANTSSIGSDKKEKFESYDPNNLDFTKTKKLPGIKVHHAPGGKSSIHLGEE